MKFESGSYQELIFKLDQFIRKYYLNQLVRGSLYTLGLVLGTFLLFNVLEYFLYLPMWVRKVLFFSFIGGALSSFYFWVGRPLLRYFRLGNVLSHEEAAQIIGSHFTHVEDKLLNILQLKKQSASAQHAALINASIDQKTKSIQLVPFKSAIDITKNRKYLKYALPPVLVLVFLLMVSPGIITEGAQRLIQNNKEFSKPAPFTYNLGDQKLEVLQYHDYNFIINTEGDIVPNELWIDIEGFQYRMEKLKGASFQYVFKNVQNDVKFYVQSGQYRSETYSLNVLEVPNLNDMQVVLNYPSYLGRKNEFLDNIGDITLPEGTQIEWLFNTAYTDSIKFWFSLSDMIISADKKNDDIFKYKKRIGDSQNYKIYLKNQFVPIADSLLYSLNVIKDEYPAINAQQIIDSIDNKTIYFVGSTSDDYGLRNLEFHYSITDEKGIQSAESVQKISINGQTESSFDYILHLDKINPRPGDKVTFYFQVWDNDGVNGSKTTKSNMMMYAVPTLEEIKAQDQANDETIKKELNEALSDLNKVSDEMKKLREKLLQEKQMNWQDKKELEKLLDKQLDIKEKLKEAKKKLEENIKNQEEFQTAPEEIKNKEEQLKDMMEKALDPEKEELMKKIQELLQELEKEDAVQMMEQLEMDNETQEKEMDRMLQLYKQLEMEKDIKDFIEKLDQLAEKQEDLAEKTEDQGEKDDVKEQEKLQEEQKKLNEEMEKMSKELKELEKKNESLSPPKDMGENNEEDMDDIQEDMDNAEDQLEKSDNKGASKNQKKAASKMKKAASKMSQSMQSGQADQAGEDIKTLRQLLENLVKMSFEQEDLFKTINQNMVNSPSYLKSIREQFKLKNDFKMIEDTLVALSNRNSDIESFVMEKVAEVKRNLNESITELEERLIPTGQEKQRRTMKNLNDLALMLSESLEQAQQQAASGMPGSQMCQNPGGKGAGKSGKVPMDKITQGQQGLNEDLQSLKEKMDKEGKKSGKEGKDGKDGKEGKEGVSSKDFAQAAARQAALRKALEEVQKNNKEQGRGSKLLEEVLDNMDKIETDLVNKRFNNETLTRMKDIETRLLEAERAEQQREMDNKRESETAQQRKNELPPSIKEYLKQKESEIEMYKSISPSLKPYYKTMVNGYFNKLKQN